MKNRSLFLAALLMVMVLMLDIVPACADNTYAKQYPYKAVAQMNIKYECGCRRTGSGTMVGRRGLITAGHNLICPYHSRWASDIQFKFGIKNSRDCLYTYTGRYTMHVYDTFKNGYNSANDIGYVVFSKDVGKTTGWYGIYAPSDYDLSDERFHMTAYDSGNMFTDWMYLYTSSSYSFTFYTRQSASALGAGIFVEDEGSSGPTLLGVYTTYGGGKCYGRKVTQNIINDMRKNGGI